MNIHYHLANRGLTSELNGLLGVCERLHMSGGGKVFVTYPKCSIYFKHLPFYQIYKRTDVISDVPLEDAIDMDSKNTMSFARRHHLLGLPRSITSNFLQFTDYVQQVVDSTIRNLNLPEEYACFHIRRGDKVNEKLSWLSKRGPNGGEAIRINFDKYLYKLKSYKDISTIFIMTDDFKVISEAKAYIEKYNLKYKLRYITPKNHLGHSTIDCRNGVFTFTISDIMTILSEISIAKLSTCFVGTYSSNIFRFILNTYYCGGGSKAPTKFLSLDCEEIFKEKYKC